MSGVGVSTDRSNDLVVVDDDKLILERVKRNLRNTKWVVTCFMDTEEALSHLRHPPLPRVLIVDNRMPRIDGVDLLEQLSQDTDVGMFRVYLCSIVHPPQDICARVEELGAHFVSKEVLCDKNELLEVLGQDLTAQL